MKLSTLCAIMGAGLVLTGCGASQDVRALKAQVTEAQDTADEAKQAVEELEQRVTDQEDEIEALKGRVDDLEARPGAD